jgi:sec-independent protein translocase protein TatA
MEMVVVLAIALLVLSPKRLPEAGKAVGREFKNSVVGGSDGGDAPELTLPATESDAIPARESSGLRRMQPGTAAAMPRTGRARLLSPLK